MKNLLVWAELEEFRTLMASPDRLNSGGPSWSGHLLRVQIGCGLEEVVVVEPLLAACEQDAFPESMLVALAMS